MAESDQRTSLGRPFLSAISFGRAKEMASPAGARTRYIHIALAIQINAALAAGEIV